jgi:hypothetical protein
VRRENPLRPGLHDRVRRLPQPLERSGRHDRGRPRPRPRHRRRCSCCCHRQSWGVGVRLWHSALTTSGRFTSFW